jgi:phage tail protein X
MAEDSLAYPLHISEAGIPACGNPCQTTSTAVCRNGRIRRLTMMKKTGRRRFLAVLWVLAVLPALLLSLSRQVLAVSESEKGTVVRLPEGTYHVEESFVYEVHAGDHLHWLAAKHYGDARQWVRILEANRDSIRNPNRLQVGQKLTIPSNVSAP